MNGEAERIPSGSQTVGPYFRIGLQSMIERTPEIALETGGMIAIEGQVFDLEGAPVTDAMLEFWSPGPDLACASIESERSGFPHGFTRAFAGDDGRFSVVLERPAQSTSGENPQAEHFIVLVFARGLLRHLLTRVYPGHGPNDQGDLVLSKIPEERRDTLIALEDKLRTNVFHWNVQLQGPRETVFFAW